MPDDVDVPDWSPGSRPPERLVLGPVVLRRWRTRDADALDPVIEASRAHLRGFMPWATNHDRASTEAYLSRCESQWDDRTAFNYAITEAGGDLLGSAGLMGRVGPAALELGYWVRVDRTHQGLATQTSVALTEAAFGLAEVQRVEIHHDVANTVSARIPARLGFSRLREVDAEVDSEAASGRHAIWAVTRPEWPTPEAVALIRAATD